MLLTFLNRLESSERHVVTYLSPVGQQWRPSNNGKSQAKGSGDLVLLILGAEGGQPSEQSRVKWLLTVGLRVQYHDSYMCAKVETPTLGYAAGLLSEWCLI